MQNIKQFKKFTCIGCLEDKDVLSDLDTNPLFLCASCDWIDRTQKQIIVELQGAPAGYVKGTENRVRNSTSKTSFKGS